MRVIDLTHTIAPEMPVYPGTEPPKLQQANTYERDGFKETLLSLYSHTGTHMDPPAHLYAGRTTLDAMPAAQFVGQAVVIDCSELGAGDRIGLSFLERSGAALDSAEFVLFYTGWSRYWGKPEYFGDYPCITPEVVEFLLRTGKKGVGFDTIGVDPVADTNLTLHKQLFLEREIVVIENLMNLDQFGAEPFLFCALPLKYENSDGAPIRAVGILPE